MTTEEMKALPVGTIVESVKTGERFMKVADVVRDMYRCSFRPALKRGGYSPSIVKSFHGARIRLAVTPETERLSS